MLKNYVKIAWRNLTKNKVFSLINILGLTIGITVCLMIFLFIINEFSVDNFHKKGDNIYRVMRHFKSEGKSSAVSYLSGMYAPALLNDFKGEIKKAVRVQQTDGLITIGNQSFHEKKLCAVDSDFLSLFSFALLLGNPQNALKEPGSAVLTESTAKKYFGSAANAMDKVIELDKSLQLKVTGVAKDVPSNSHLYFDVILPLSNYKDRSWMTVWINNAVYTYILLDPAASPQRLQQRLPAFLDKYMGADLKKFGFNFELSLTPLKDVYFENNAFDEARHGDKVVVYIFLSIAVLILLIACINFMNLSTVRAVERSKEVGLRKVLGALRKQLAAQFIGESLLLASISCLLSVLLMLFLTPFYNQLLGYQLTVSWTSLPIYVFLGGVVLVVGLLAGTYPALVLSAFSPIDALKGKLRLGKGGSFFRQGLVIIQFAISVFLITGTIIVTSQMSYMKNKQLGYDKEQSVIVPIDNNDIFHNLSLFRTKLMEESSVVSVSAMSGVPGGYFDQHSFDVEGHEEKWTSRTEFADFQFVKTLGLKVIAGRDFSPQFPTDTMQAVLINRTAAAKLGWTPTQALGKWIKNTVRDGDKRRIIGVVEDFNFLSLKENMNSLVISPDDDRRQVVIRLKGGDIPAAIAIINKVYNMAAPAYPFEYSFLDQQFDHMYQNDLRQQTILSIFAGLAILIACLGLFGLASFTATKRTKEIGVRKVLGSSAQNIVLLLSRDLLKPVAIATCIAVPGCYFIMHNWLQNFAYRTPLSWWTFALAALITFAIAFLTIGAKALKAAIANPAKSLRSE